MGEYLLKNWLFWPWRCIPWNKNKFCGFFLRSNIKLAQLARVSPNSEWHLNLHKSLHFIHINQRFGFQFFPRVLRNTTWVSQSLFSMDLLYNLMFIQNEPTLCHSCSCCVRLHCVIRCKQIPLNHLWLCTVYNPHKKSCISMEKLVE